MVRDRLRVRKGGQHIVKKPVSFGQCGPFAPGIDRQHERRLVGGEGEGLCGHLRDVAVVDVDFWLVTVQQTGGFSGGEVEIGRFVDRAELLRREVGQDKLRRVVKLVEHHVARADARGKQSVRQPVRVSVQRGIRPRPAGGRVDHGRLFAEAAHIAQKAGHPGEAPLEDGAERGYIVGFVHVHS